MMNLILSAKFATLHFMIINYLYGLAYKQPRTDNFIKKYIKKYKYRQKIVNKPNINIAFKDFFF